MEYCSIFKMILFNFKFFIVYKPYLCQNVDKKLRRYRHCALSMHVATEISFSKCLDYKVHGELRIYVSKAPFKILLCDFAMIRFKVRW